VSRETDLHHCFRAVLTALAHPGRPQTLPPSPGFAGYSPDSAGESGGLVKLVLEAIWEPAQVGTQVVVIDGDPEAATLELLPRGGEAEPQHGSTALVVAAPGGPESAVWLDGPGLKELARARLPLSAAALEARARACASPPMGIDLLIVTSDGAIVGLPRTTRVRPG
jgi:alpha-D-ribose 1-methylphosphonate 5-triphosphate synthase subunit PhnH